MLHLFQRTIFAKVKRKIFLEKRFHFTVFDCIHEKLLKYFPVFSTMSNEKKN